MKSKKYVCSFLLTCALMFGVIGFTQSQKTIAYAMPSVKVDSCTWHVTGGKDLKRELWLVYGRFCPQGRLPVVNIIGRCIREHRTLVVKLRFPSFFYSII